MFSGGQRKGVLGTNGSKSNLSELYWEISKSSFCYGCGKGATVSDEDFNPLNANPSKWSKTLEQFVACCPRIV